MGFRTWVLAKTEVLFRLTRISASFPAQAGIHASNDTRIPASRGMTEVCGGNDGMTE